MRDPIKPRWVEWSRRLGAIAQNGLAYATDKFDQERYTSVRDVAAEITSEHWGIRVEDASSVFAAEVGHATPKVDVRGVVFQEEKVLLVKERDDGLWSLPGGWAEVSDSPSEAVVREVYEESGYYTEAVRLLAVYDRKCHRHTPYPFSVYMLFFLCTVVGSSPVDSIETCDVGFFGRDELPELSLYRVTPEQVDRLFQTHNNADQRADFD